MNRWTRTWIVIVVLVLTAMAIFLASGRRVRVTVSRTIDLGRNDVVAAIMLGDPLTEVESFLKKDPELVRSHFDGRSLLDIAASSKRPDVVASLLRSGADPDILSVNGGTALAAAVYHEEWDSVRLLLESGADPNMRDRWGLSAGDRAKLAGPEQARMYETIVEEAANGVSTNGPPVRSEDGSPRW